MAARPRPRVAVVAIAVMLAAGAARASDPAAKAALDRLLDDNLAATYRRYPPYATLLGVPGYNDKLPDLTIETLRREQGLDRASLDALERIDASKLDGQDRLSHALLRRSLADAVAGQRFRDSEALVVATRFGPHRDMPFMAQVTPIQGPQDVRDYIARLQAMPGYVDAVVERTRPGLANGWMASRGVVDRVVAAIDAQLADDARKSALAAPVDRLPASVAAEEREALAVAVRRAIADDYQPALRRYKAFLLADYRPRAPVNAGLASMPGGAAYYDFLIRSQIAPDGDAASIHATGIAEVASLREAIGAVAKDVGFAGSTDAFIDHLRTDARYRFKSADAVLDAYRAMPVRVDPKLPRLFHQVPRMRYVVRAMTPAEASSGTAPTYVVGSTKRDTPAYFTVNAAAHADEFTWSVESVFLHEAMPGHHMQFARAEEVEGLHPWRAVAAFDVAYVEGWALYAEWLGHELGMYADPYARYGALSAQLLRAGRLVVDTGIHAQGWTRERAYDYMVKVAGVDPALASSEVDRYFSNPSQALGYMIGYRKIRQLRERAATRFGQRFDVRDFHAVVIDSGSMPLAVLEPHVDAWIARGGGRPR